MLRGATSDLPTSIQPPDTSKRRTRRSRGLLSTAQLGLLGITLLGLGATLLLSLIYRARLPQKEEREADDLIIYAPPSPEFCAKRRPPLVCAHGGDQSQNYPNTARAFRAAIDAGADCVEIDAAHTEDHELVVLHVRELQELTKQPGKQVGDFTLAQLKALAWPNGDVILTVDEALAITMPFVSLIILDVKTYTDQATGRPKDEWDMADDLVLTVHEEQCTNCLIWAKSDKVLARIKDQSPGQRVGLIVSNETEELRASGFSQPLRMAAPEVVGAWWGSVSPDLRRTVHGAGKELYTWTCNNAAMLRHVLDHAVDAVVTNYPGMALTAIEYRMSLCGQVAGRGGGGHEL